MMTMMTTTMTANDNLTSSTTNNNNQPPTVLLFSNSNADDGNNLLFQSDMATRTIRVAHMNEQMKNQQEHFSLKNNLMEHLLDAPSVVFEVFTVDLV
jgi:hypothetical protein